MLLLALTTAALSSALGAMAAELIQSDLTLSRNAGMTVSISCGGIHQCTGSYVYWYQKKGTGAFRVLLRANKDSGALDYKYDHPQKNDFSPVKRGNNHELTIIRLKPAHTASYYCACYAGSDVKLFGSGTKLYVTGQVVKGPVVTVYPVASGAQLEGRSLLLCTASSMFPPEVKFSWKRQEKDGGLLDAGGEEQLELRESGRSASILLLPKQHSDSKYRCSVRHEGAETTAHTGPAAPAATCPPEREPTVPPTVPPTDPPTVPPTEPPLPSEEQVKLLCLFSTLLTVKVLLLCSALPVLVKLRASSSCSHSH